MALEILINSVDQISKLVYKSLSIEQRADAFVSTCSFELLDESADLVIEEKQTLLIQDGATKYFAGVVANVQTANMADGTESLLHTVEGQDYNILVEEVAIDQLEEYAAVTDAVIIDDLFDKYLPEIDSHTPGAGGYVQELHVFAEISFEAVILREALDRIATEVESTALTGYWYIDFDKYLHYFNIEDNAPAWTLSDTPDNVNSFDYFSAVRRDRQGAAIVNRILVCGADVALFVQDYDSYNYYGKWFEAVVRDNTLLGVSEVLEHGNALLGKWAYPDEVYEVTTRKAGLRAGMNVEFDCTLFGTADRLNRILNPSFEINVTDGWTFVQGGAGGSAVRDGARSSVGNFSCRLTASNVGSAYQQSDIIAVADGEVITAQVRIYRTSDVASDIRIHDATHGINRVTLGASYTDLWEVLTVTWENDTGGAVNVLIILRNTAADGSSQVWFDACVAEIDKGPRPATYIDGTLPYCSWDGVAHNSVSRRAPVFMVKQLTLTWPENTPTYALSLGGDVSQTALLSARSIKEGPISGGGPIVDGQLPLASRGWSHNLVFSATDHDTVAWTLGTINTAAGQTFSIVAGNTGNMAAVTYVYFDTDTSLTVLQTTVNATGAVGSNMIMVAVCRPRAAGVDATFLVFGGEGHNALVDTSNIADDAITAAKSQPGLQDWSCTMTFSATDHDTVAWTLGTLTTARGTSYNIVAGNTGNMAATTYVFLDTAVSLTILQTTVVASNAVGDTRLLVAVCGISPAGKNATFTVFGGAGLGVYIGAGNVAANAITANEIAANTITAAEILANTITAGQIAANTITAGEILANTISANEILANTITAGEIAANTITANEILANSITAGCMNVGTLSAITANMGTLTAGVIQTAAAGNNRVIIDIPNGIRGIDAANVVQFQLNPATGKATAGAGNVILDSDGLTLVYTDSSTARVKWKDGATVKGYLGCYVSAPYSPYLLVNASAPAASNLSSAVFLIANPHTGDSASVRIFSGRTGSDPYISFSLGGVSKIQIEDDYTNITELRVANDARISQGLYVGSLAINPDIDDIICDGTIQTAKGYEWDLGHYWSGAVTAEGRIDISIGGVGYWIMARIS